MKLREKLSSRFRYWYQIGKGWAVMALNFRALQDRLRERLLTHIDAGELTGLQLARETGFQQAHISNFLNRKRGLSLEAMDTILTATGISISELLPKENRRRAAEANACGE